MATTTMGRARVTARGRKTRWRLWLVVLAALSAGGFFVYQRYTSAAAATATAPTTVAVTQGDITSAVTATGNIQPTTKVDLTAATSGVAKAVLVKVGDSVTKSQPLLQLDTADLDIAVKTAEGNLESAQVALEKAQQGTSDAEIKAAQAKVNSAQVALNSLYTGPTSAEVTEAQSRLRAAQINLEKAQAGPTETEIANAKNKVETAKNSLWSTQSNRDAICGRAKNPDEDTNCNQARAAVNNAEIGVQTAHNDLDTLLAGPDGADIGIAQESVRQAEAALAQLRQGPTSAEVASAQANIVQAQSSLTELQAGPDALTIRQAEIAVRQAETALEQARHKVEQATLTAPFDGVVTAVNVAQGATVGATSAAFQLVDFNNLQIETQVSELDRAKLKVGQPVKITLEALSGVTLQGEVTTINPTATVSNGVVNYPITVKVTQSNPNVAAGMTASLTIVVESKQGALRVKTSAIQTVNGQKTVKVLRDGQTVQVPVQTGITDGALTEISSPDLKAGDQVVVSSGTSAGTTSNSGGGAGGMMIPGMGGPPPR